MAYVGLTAGLLAFAALIEMAVRGPLDAFGLMLALAVTGPVALVRILPVAAAGLVGAAAFLTQVSGSRPPLAGLVALGLLLYHVARRSALTAGLLAAPFFAHALVVSPAGAPVLAVTGAAAVAGVARRRHDEAARYDASSRAVEGTLQEFAARGERTRIARELHDVVAHHISMIAVQAETARLTTPDLPAEGGRRLVGIGDTARAALTEMRRLLGVLREESATGPERRPQPGLTELTDLLDGARELSAATTRLIVRGPMAPLDPGVELAAYRIVQEALTNARRHASGAAVDVELEYGEDSLRVRVRDNGPGPSTVDDVAPGHGLAGMRERAAAVGGRLRSGPTVVGGFLVEAVLPGRAVGP
jgi:signal transduction histidine kinase